MLDNRWLSDNISILVGDGVSSLLWKEPWLNGVSLADRYARLLDLVINKCATVVGLSSLGWEVNGEAWKWRRILFA